MVAASSKTSATSCLPEVGPAHQSKRVAEFEGCALERAAGVAGPALPYRRHLAGHGDVVSTAAGS